MLTYIQETFISNFSHRLDLFKQSYAKCNFRCPYCGDSKKNKRKARGFLIVRGDSYYYTCHNCGKGASFDGFLNDLDPNLYRNYVLEKIKARKSTDFKIGAVSENDFKVKRRSESIVEIFDEVEQIGFDYSELTEVSILAPEHPVIKYLAARKIQGDMLENFMYAKKFIEFASKHKEEMIYITEHPRLIIPFYNECGSDVYQARAFGDEQPKYYTIKYDQTATKVYGMHQIDHSRPVYVVEGPIDSMFLDNAIAVCSSSLVKTFYSYELNIDNLVFVWDNEPRNKEILEIMQRAIKLGVQVVIWNTSPDKKTDINDMVRSGMSREHIMEIIKSRTFSGIRALMEFNKWKRI